MDDAVELRDGYADLDDVRLHYVEGGSGPPLIFLHGFPDCWWLWEAQLRELGRDHRVVAADMRGSNLSSAPADVEAYRMGPLLADLSGLAEHLGVEGLSLVGHDWGGIVAWAFAASRPEALERLVVLDAPPPFTWGRELERSPRQRQAVRYMVDLAAPAPHAERLLAENEFAVLDALVVAPGIQRGYLTEEDRARYHEAWSRPGALTGNLNYYRASGMGEQVQHGQPPEVRRRLEALRVEVPTLVVWGEQDHALLPGLTEGLERWVPHVRVEMLAHAGHWTPQERADEVSSLIREFVASG